MSYYDDRTLGDVRTLTCPHCGRENTDHAGPEPGDRLTDGDVGICYGCGRLGVYNAALGVYRVPTAEEAAELEASPDVRAARHALAESYDPLQASELRWGTP